MEWTPARKVRFRSSMVIMDAALEVSGKEGDREGEDQVGDGEQEIAFEVAEGVGGDVFRVLGEFVDTDDGEEG